MRCARDGCGQIELPGVPLGSFYGSAYDEVTLPLEKHDVFVFCSDGVFEAMNPAGAEFGAQRLIQLVAPSRELSAKEIVDKIATAVEAFREGATPNDDMTIVVVRMTA